MIKKIAAWTYIGLVLIFMYAPIITLIIFSFTESRIPGVWAGFSFGNYVSLFENDAIGSAVVNTLIIALVSSVIATFLGTLAAVGISNMRKIPKAIVSGTNKIPMLNAEIVTSLAILIFFSAIGIAGGYFTLIVCHVLICTPYVVLSVMPRIQQLNPNLYEAALDLGASPTKALFKVIIPQLIPGMVAGALLAFTLSLDDFVLSAYNRGTSGINTISTYLYEHLKKGVNPALYALSAIIFLVIIGVLIAINIRSYRAKKKLIGGKLN